MPSPFYSLVQLSDLHFSTDRPSPFDEQPAGSDVVAINVDQMLRDGGIASCASAPALAAAVTMVEPMLSAPLSTERPRGCLVSGDICTWPYTLTFVNEVYRYFDGQMQYGNGRPIGFGSGVSEQFMFLLGNHDTNGVLFDTNYRGSPFHRVHHAADLTRCLVVPTTHRWIVFFIVRTDFVLTLGWLGPSVPLLDPFFLQRFRWTVARMRNGRGDLADQHCTGDTYDQAIKILVMHHSPLRWTDYPSFDQLLDEIRVHKVRGLRNLARRKRDYEMTRLQKRSAVMRFCREMGIHLVLFGHTHEPFRFLDGGTLYVDTGSTAAATTAQLQSAAQDPDAHVRYDFSAFEFFDDNTLAVKSYTMTSESSGFDAGPEAKYDVLAASVQPHLGP